MEKIRDRIRKLLRLARDKGASENEAASAMAMASRLMLQQLRTAWLGPKARLKQRAFALALEHAR
jgi:hypothetical protein